MKAGERLNQYILERYLDEGGMGEVWLAKHHILGRKVAIKSLRAQFVRQASLRQRFRNEAVTLSQLHHPGIVALHDYLDEDEGAYLVMEYVEGIPLDDYIRTQSGPITGAKLKDFLTQILEAFAYAHAQNVVHRDIKPGNFMVTPEGKIKVLDFGIAKVLQGGKGITKTGTQIGTVLYMSPEQVEGKEIDIRSDIYSLGVTLFTMATGQPPYPSDATEFHVYKQIVEVPLPDARSVYQGVDPAIQDIIRNATAKRKEDRYQNCGEMLQAVGGLVTNLQVAPPKPIDSSEERDKGETVVVEPGEQTQINEPGTVIQEPENPETKRKRDMPVLAIGLPILVLGLLVGAYILRSGSAFLQKGKVTSFDEVQIGQQIWMKKNLDVANFANGDPIPQARTKAEWEKARNEHKPSWCFFANDQVNGEKFGRLYNWFVVSDPRGLAPQGWHLPSKAEWDELATHLGGKLVAGGKMKNNFGWTKVNGLPESGPGTNESGFSALQSGFRSFWGWSETPHWWSSTESENPESAWSYYILSAVPSPCFTCNYSALWNWRSDKGDGMSVRFIKDLDDN